MSDLILLPIKDLLIEKRKVWSERRIHLFVDVRLMIRSLMVVVGSR